MMPVLPNILHKAEYKHFWTWDEEKPWLPKATDDAPAEVVEAINAFIDAVEPKNPTNSVANSYID